MGGLVVRDATPEREVVAAGDDVERVHLDRSDLPQRRGGAIHTSPSTPRPQPLFAQDEPARRQR